jgi:hypothetical protein
MKYFFSGDQFIGYNVIILVVTVRERLGLCEIRVVADPREGEVDKLLSLGSIVTFRSHRASRNALCPSRDYSSPLSLSRCQSCPTNSDVRGFHHADLSASIELWGFAFPINLEYALLPQIPSFLRKVTGLVPVSMGYFASFAFFALCGYPTSPRQLNGNSFIDRGKRKQPAMADHRLAGQRGSALAATACLAPSVAGFSFRSAKRLFRGTQPAPKGGSFKWTHLGLDASLCDVTPSANLSDVR